MNIINYEKEEIRQLNENRNAALSHYRLDDLKENLNKEHFKIFNTVESRFKKNIKKFTKKIQKKIINDKIRIEENFNFTVDENIKVKPLGDYHDKGNAVCVISDRHNNKLIFKPRNSSALFSFYNLIKKISPSIKTPKYIEGFDYSWIEYLDHEHKQITSDNLVNLGVILGASFCTNTSDLIAENFILNNNGATPIDVEVFCRPIIKDLDGEIDKLSTVLGTGMLPILPIDRNENITIIELALSLSPTSKENSINYILKGFKKAYFWFVKNKEKLFFNFQGRILIRYTKSYSSYLNHMYLPNRNTYEIQKKNYTDKLGVYLKKLNFGNDIVYSELEQLLNNDIPSFYYKNDGTHIFNTVYNKKINALAYSSSDVLKMKLAQLSTDDLRTQIEIIKDSLNILEKGKERKYTEVLSKQRLSTFFGDMYLSRDRVLHLCTDSFYYGLTVNNENNFIPSKLPFSDGETIYSNFDAFLRLLLLKKNEDLITKKLKKIRREIMTIKTNDVYYGRSGLLLAVCLSYETTKSPISKEIADYLYKKIITDKNFNNYIFSSDFKKPQTGFAYGASGVALAIWRYSRVFSNQKAEGLARKLIDWEDTHYIYKKGTWNDFRENKYSKKMNHGYCNGSVGCLISRANILEKEEFIKRKYNFNPVLEALKNEKNLGWCHGLSAYFELHLSLKGVNEEISNKLLKHIPVEGKVETNGMQSLSLMNGISGLKYIYDNKKNERFISPISFITYENN